MDEEKIKKKIKEERAVWRNKYYRAIENRDVGGMTYCSGVLDGLITAENILKREEAEEDG